MKDEGSQQEDVAGLFRKFGGDVAGYKEFTAPQVPAAAASTTAPAGGWALVNGARTAPPEPVVAPPRAAPAPEAPLFAAPPVAPPAQTAAPAAAPAVEPPPGEAAAPRELDVLFARLAGHPPPTAAPGQGLMARWRKPA